MNINKNGMVEELNELNNQSESLFFRLRQSFDLNEPNLSEYEIQISEFIGKNITNAITSNIAINFTLYESESIESRMKYLDE